MRQGRVTIVRDRGAEGRGAEVGGRSEATHHLLEREHLLGDDAP